MNMVGRSVQGWVWWSRLAWLPVVLLLLLAALAAATPALAALSASTPTLAAADNPSPLQAKSEFLIITRGAGVIEVLDLVTVTNPRAEAVDEVALATAEGAVLVGAEAAGTIGEFSQAEGGLLIHGESLPGHAERSYRLQYRLAAPRLPVTLVRPILYPTEQLTVMTEDGVLDVWSADLTEADVNIVADVPMRTLISQEREPVAVWRLGLMPAGGPSYDPALPVHGPRQGVTGFFWAALGAMVAVAAGSMLAQRWFGDRGSP